MTADKDWADLCQQVPRWQKLKKDADEQTPPGDGGTHDQRPQQRRAPPAAPLTSTIEQIMADQDATDTLVPKSLHSTLTNGPSAWTETRIEEIAFRAALGAFGSANFAENQRLYRALQAYEWAKNNSK